ncbi:DUF6272 family protein [Candidatus Venteria ishoeyi]|uniref:ATP-binding protein n=1 Tax=Candidatus Venteria ishoeyi TaxID=1899563 RepID=A0A1H6F871_9GAMM|nr:DUF6272 family protein [Candidatus Venteria ishoeyi]MDM8546498.1 DUF6272 family protein [Candidatus Venteria ishoeyi]SEH06322.1 Uncharacterised protein [Candidatus Venteria ishoeyi]
MQIFGDFTEVMPKGMEYLVLGFSTQSLPLKQRWRNNGLSADFIADYLQTFFVGNKTNTTDNSHAIPASSKNAAKYIANELLENAMKFSTEGNYHQTRIAFHLYENKLVFQVYNVIEQSVLQQYQAFIQKLLDSDDPQTLYMQQMEANASDDEHHHSGLGFLSMVCDYSAKLGWKFEPMPNEPGLTIATTMVTLTI